MQAAAVVGLLTTFNEQFRQGVGITKIITLAEELPATSRYYKSGMTAFADELHKGKRTPDGYAQGGYDGGNERNEAVLPAYIRQTAAEAAGKRCDPYRDAETDRASQEE